MTTLTEMVDRARQMAGVVDVPVFADADTGYGNPINVRRTVEKFDRAGVAGINLEDQIFPKKCGHFDRKAVVVTAEMVAKHRAAVDAQSDDDFVFIGRTDARAVEGFESAVERSEAYLDAGADVLFVEAPESVAELEDVAERIDVPLLANMTDSGRIPMLTVAELEALRYQAELFLETGFKAVLKVLQDVYGEIVETGTQQGVLDELVSWGGRNDITCLDEITELERQSVVESDDAS
ncbi:isocitrate lyase/PEP mutase family protein [Haladaptatus sp. NG-WS-4]